uniref:Uncharacterized protein n=1 Tax=Solanum lycopersicum TaxID=4081 RepID=A0A3Q7FVJ1_SOLLC
MLANKTVNFSVTLAVPPCINSMFRCSFCNIAVNCDLSDGFSPPLTFGIVIHLSEIQNNSCTTVEAHSLMNANIYSQESGSLKETPKILFSSHVSVSDGTKPHISFRIYKIQQQMDIKAKSRSCL